MKKYNIINNTLGWLIFVVAAFTYLSTIEPTASFWDCPEFIAQGFKSEVGHPPGNPIFILAARFATNFAGGDVMKVAACVNSMSALLSAATILLLFWTITHLVKKLVVRDGEEDQMGLGKYLVVMGSGVCGALVYTWSDTFWFSAVEAEVYAFSSFCTALVVWLMLKWEDRADDPKSDRWLILIAYVFGFSLGVHLLNLLCIPALALIFYYRKTKNSSVKGSLLTLLVSFVVIVLILWGLEPGFVELGGDMDRFFVNVLGLPFNSGVIFYAVLLLAVFVWSFYELYTQKSQLRMKLSFFFSVFLSGIPFIGDSLLIPVVILVALGVYLFKFVRRVPARVFANVALSMFMIFIGFTCYGLILIRSNANTPLDENSPNNMYALAGYLSRDQYGSSPLLYGQVYTADVQYKANDEGQAYPVKGASRAQYARMVKQNPADPDRYIEVDPNADYKYPSAMCMLFPRVWSSQHANYYDTFFGGRDQLDQVQVGDQVIDQNGNPSPNYAVNNQMQARPSFGQNLSFFMSYQMNYMYWRYFMWNFAGRQNDIQGTAMNSDVDHGNWISGIPFIDNARLGDQSLMPDEIGAGNKGHNVFYMLPLLLGIIGLLWQAFAGKKGIEQFWVVFFLFFMTGIAIVLYLNQTPLQPRERDYAYAGSFYAFSIWVGMGVAGLWRLVAQFVDKKNATTGQAKAAPIEPAYLKASGASTAVAAVAAVIGLIVPLQMVSQTWDDHDRSNRWACHDFGMNYLSSIAPNGIIFTNGDNDTFPLWYLQEVEGYRTDVRVVNLSYLATDWYIGQMQRAAYDSKPLPMQATATTFAYGNRQGNLVENNTQPLDCSKSLAQVYSNDAKDIYMESDHQIVTGKMSHPVVQIPANAAQAVAQGVIPASQQKQAADSIVFDMSQRGTRGQVTSSDVMALDIINSSIRGGWKRPVYFACTVDDRLYTSYLPYMQCTGMAYQITPVRNADFTGEPAINTDRMYQVVTTKFRWGNLDKAKPGSVYLDETVRRMVSTTRRMMLDLAEALIAEGDSLKGGAKAQERYAKALHVVQLMEKKIPEASCPYDLTMGGKSAIAQIYLSLSEKERLGRADLKQRGIKLYEQEIKNYGQYVRYVQHLRSEHPELGVSRITEAIAGTSNQPIGQYVHELLDYQKLNPKGFDALVKQQQAMGVDTGEALSMLDLYNQQQAQQLQPAEEQQPAPAPQPADSQGGDSGNEAPAQGAEVLPGFGDSQDDGQDVAGGDQ